MVPRGGSGSCPPHHGGGVVPGGAVVLLGRGAPRVIIVPVARTGSRGATPGGVVVPGGGVPKRFAPAANTKLAAARRQCQNRQRRVAAVSVSLESPAAPDQRRRRAG